MAKQPLGRGWLILIAIFKLFKATGLVTLGVIAFGIARSDSERMLARWESIISFAPGHRLLHEAIAKIADLQPRQLSEIAIASLVYAAVFLVEGGGLLAKARWAEYVTSGVTLSFIPLELYEIAKKPTAIRVVALLVNIAVVVYLVWRIHREKKLAAASRPTPPAPAEGTAVAASLAHARATQGRSVR
jgi:uncharacterized membrane protein (DUF2068 family)